MPTLPDLLYVVLFAVVSPLTDYLVFWPAFRRRSQADPPRARVWLWAWTIITSWPLVAVGAALWVWNDRSWASFGFAVPDGWRLWTSVALILLVAAYLAYAVAVLARSADQRAGVRRQMGDLAAVIGPHDRAELCWFGGLSLTAGFCEEFLVRGYFIWAFAPWLGWWGAAAVSVLFFAVGHAYQGWDGVVKTGIVGALLTLVVAIFQSLWPAIVLHFLWDLGMGVIAWLALRGGQARDGAADVDTHLQPQPASGVDSRPAQAEPSAVTGDEGM